MVTKILAGQWNELFTAEEMTNTKFMQFTQPVRVWIGASTDGVSADDGILLNAGDVFPLGSGFGVHVYGLNFEPGSEITGVVIDCGSF